MVLICQLLEKPCLAKEQYILLSALFIYLFNYFFEVYIFMI